MKLANDALNNSPIPQDSSRRTPEQIFSKTNEKIHAKYYKIFGCIVFVLDSAQQLNNPYHKIGICIGRSLQHGGIFP